MDGFEGASSSESVLDLSRLNLNNNSLDTVSEKRRKDTKQLYLCYNRMTVLTESISSFSNLEFLDISNNTLSVICEDITRLTKLKTLIAKNNRLNEGSLPKHFGSLQLEVLNFSGNRFEEMPSQCLQLLRLQSLSLGGNRLKSIPAEIESLTRWYTNTGTLLSKHLRLDRNLTRPLLFRDCHTNVTLCTCGLPGLLSCNFLGYSR